MRALDSWTSDQAPLGATFFAAERTFDVIIDNSANLVLIVKNLTGRSVLGLVCVMEERHICSSCIKQYWEMDDFQIIFNNTKLGIYNFANL